LEFFSVGGRSRIVYKPALASGAAAWCETPRRKNILTPQKIRRAAGPAAPAGQLEKFSLSRDALSPANAGILVTRVEFVKKTGRKKFRHRGRPR